MTRGRVRRIGSVLVLLTAVLAVAWTEPASERPEEPALPREADLAAFGWIEVWIDPKGAPLAAWQLEVDVLEGGKIVGIEGGGHPAYAEPPHYDPKAIQEERAVLAAFHTGEGRELPSSRVRVATVMVETRGDRVPSCAITLVTAATVGGDRIDVIVKGEVYR